MRLGKRARSPCATSSRASAPSGRKDLSPVTVADREAEAKIRDLLAKAHPDDGIVGEEFGQVEGSSGVRWIIDPIDGTKSFVQGVPPYGVLIAREGPDGVDVGCCYMPALDEMVWAAKGEGCWWNGRQAAVSTVAELDKPVSAIHRGRVLPNRAASRSGRSWSPALGCAGGGAIVTATSSWPPPGRGQL